MTNPPTPTRPPTLSQAIVAVKAATPPPTLWHLVFGGLLFLLGVGILASDIVLGFHLKQAPHTLNIVLGAGLAFVGLLVPGLRYISPAVQQVTVWAGPYVPVPGGRRSGDPPKDEGA